MEGSELLNNDQSTEKSDAPEDDVVEDVQDTNAGTPSESNVVPPGMFDLDLCVAMPLLCL